MRYLNYATIFLPLLLILSGCGQKPYHHPRKPNYAVVKPKVRYAPNKTNLHKMIKKLQGSPYVWAEEGPNNFDCSGYTYYLYGSMGIEIPRVAREQARCGQAISVAELTYGDLIFFDTDKRPRGKITHVGVYMGNGWFTHASTKDYEVIYSNLNTTAYYKQRLRICRRFLPHKAGREHKSIKPWKTPQATPKALSPVAPIATRRPAVSQQGNYFVQVGSFSGEPKQALLNKITGLGYRYKLIQFPLNGAQISKLLIGPYTKKEQALQVLPSVQENIQQGAFIAEIR
jgi:hypothetical protein